MFASIGIVNLKLVMDLYNHMKGFMIACGFMMSGHGNQTLFHKVCLFILVVVSIGQIAITGAITFISFYLIVSVQTMNAIFFNAAGVLFVNEMPVHLGVFLKQFILDKSEGGNSWKVYTMERPQMELIAKLASIGGMGIIFHFTCRYWIFDDLGIVQLHNEDFYKSIWILVVFAIATFATLTLLFNSNCISISAQSLEIDVVEPLEEE